MSDDASKIAMSGGSTALGSNQTSDFFHDITDLVSASWAQKQAAEMVSYMQIISRGMFCDRNEREMPADVGRNRAVIFGILESTFRGMALGTIGYGQPRLVAELEQLFDLALAPGGEYFKPKKTIDRDLIASMLKVPTEADGKNFESQLFLLSVVNKCVLAGLVADRQKLF